MKNTRIFYTILLGLTFILITHTIQAQYYPGGIDNTNLELWLDANQLTGTTGQPIATWGDASGKNHHATATLGNEPTLTINAINGRNAVYFNGTDFMTVPAIAGLSNKQDITLFVVLQSTTGTVIASDYAGQSNVWELNTLSGNYYLNGLKADLNPFTVYESNLANYEIITSKWANNTLGMTVGGRSAITITSGNPNYMPTVHTTISIGNKTNLSTPLTGYIAEIIVCSSLNQAQKVIIENYLYAKYATNFAGLKYNTITYNQYVTGIGKSSTDLHESASSKGLHISSTATDFLKDDGDFMIFGHQNPSNEWMTSDIPSVVTQRWQRDWYIEKSETTTNGGNVNLAFDFSEADMVETPIQQDEFLLLYRSGTTSEYSPVAYSNKIVGDQVVFTMDAPKNGYYTLGSFKSKAGAGNVFNFNGGAYIDVKDTTTFKNIEDLTLECWIKPSLFTSNNGIMGQGSLSGSYQNGWYLTLENQKIYFRMVNAANTLVAHTADVILSTTQWYHVTVVFNHNTPSSPLIYVNTISQPLTITGTSSIYSSNTNSFKIGTEVAKLANKFNGAIDEVRVWKSALTQNEIITYLCQKVNPSSAATDNLIAYFSLDEFHHTGTYPRLINKKTGYFGTLQGTLGASESLIKSKFSFSAIPMGDKSFSLEGDVPIDTDYDLEGNIISDKLTVRLSAKTGVSSSFHIYYVGGSPNDMTLPTTGNPPLVSIDRTRYWGVHLIGSGTHTYQATYYYATNDNVEILNDTRLELIYRNDATANWTRADETIIETEQDVVNADLTQRFVRIKGLTGTEIILAGGAGSLPITLSSFSAQVQNQEDVLLKWATASEINNQFFEIERSKNGIDFEKIAQLDGAGNSRQLLNYQYLDKNVSYGWWYYRLKQIDTDNQFSYASTVAVRVENFKINVFPNPFAEKISLDWGEKATENIPVQLYNLQGKLLKQTVLQKGNSLLEMNLQALPQGFYILRVYYLNGWKEMKLVKN
jgi:hypothetical protein